MGGWVKSFACARYRKEKSYGGPTGDVEERRMDEARYIAEAKLMHKINTKPDKEPNPGFIPLRPCLDPYHYIGTDKLHLTVQPTVQQPTQDPVTTVEHHEEGSRHIVQLGMWEAVREGLDRRIESESACHGLAVNRDNVSKAGPTSGREHD